MAGYRVMLKVISAGEATLAQNVQRGSAMKQQSVERALSGTDPEPLRFYRANNKKRSDKLFAGLNWPFFISKLFRNGAEGYAKIVAKLLLCDSFDLETNSIKLNGL